MGRAVAVLGVGQTRHGDRSEITYPDLVREAVKAAIDDAGLAIEDLEGIVYGSMPSRMEGVGMNHFYFAEALGAVGKEFMRTETCGYRQDYIYNGKFSVSKPGSREELAQNRVKQKKNGYDEYNRIIWDKIGYK